MISSRVLAFSFLWIVVVVLALMQGTIAQEPTTDSPAESTTPEPTTPVPETTDESTPVPPTDTPEPSDTPVPDFSDTPTPSDTPVPEFSDTPAPSTVGDTPAPSDSTPAPSDTPQPSDGTESTPEPSNEPTSEPESPDTPQPETPEPETTPEPTQQETKHESTPEPSTSEPSTQSPPPPPDETPAPPAETPQPASTGTSTSYACDGTTQGSCVNDNCAWNDGNCEEAPCDIRTKEDTCHLSAQCQWYASSSTCNVIPCSSIGDKGWCDDREDCRYVVSGSYCESTAATPVPPSTPAPPVTPCSEFKESSSCSAQSHCAFEGVLCFSAHCGQWESSPECTVMNCDWADNSCGMINQCPTLTTESTCLSATGCVWTPSTARCGTSTVSCESFTSSATCSASPGCSWNTQASPPCFTTPTSTAVCPQQTTSGNCLARGCVFVQGKCYAPGSAEICTTNVNSGACWDTAGCVWRSDTISCVPLSTMGSLNTGVYSVLPVPSVPNPASKFSVNFYGKGLSMSNSFGFVSTSENASSSCTPAVAALTMDDADDASYTVRAEVPGLTFGDYFCCYNLGTTQYLVPNYVLSVKRVAPTVTKITTTPATPYHNTQFTFKLDGTNLNKDDGFVFIAAGGSCPVQTDHSYAVVSSVGSNLRTARGAYTLPTGKYQLCYTNRIDGPVLGPTINIANVAPWFVGTTLAATAAEYTVLNKPLLEFNKQCHGAFHPSQPEAYLSGPFMNPDKMAIYYGNGVEAHPADDRCAYLLKPMPPLQAGLENKTLTTIRLEFETMGLDEDSDMRLFLPTDNIGDVVPECDSFLDETTCLDQYCSWMDSACEIGFNDLSGCPGETDIPSFGLSRSLNFRKMQSNTATVSLHAYVNSGMMLVTCTSAAIPISTGYQLTYSTTNGFCPNNCASETGTQTGECINEGEGFYCKCGAGWSGKDCQTRTTCSGTRDAATVVEGAEGIYNISQQGRIENCGFKFVANPEGSSLQRISRYGIGIELTAVVLSDDCAASSITIREDSHQGAQIAKICKQDVSDITSKFRYLLEKTDTAYIQFDFIATDSMVLTWQTVSVVCPGPPGPSGDPLEADRCDGNGECVLANFDREAIMPQYAYECICKSPYAQSAPYQSCTSCGFGYREDSYPNCTNLLTCSSNAECHNGGKCVAGPNSTQRVCECAANFYGLKCEHVDTNQTLQKKATLDLRMTMDGFAANEMTKGKSDSTLLPCQMEGSRFPCKETKRSRGKLFTTHEVGADEVLSRKFFVQEENTTSGENNILADIGLNFNKIVVNQKYRDMVRITDIRGTTVDVGESFTVSAWVQADMNTNGFLIAKVDAAFYPDGTSPVLNRGLSDALDRYTIVENLQSGEDDLVLYWGIYFDGENEQVTFIQTKGRATSSREDWLVVRHFRLGSSASTLFDGSWRYFTLKFGYTNNRHEGQIFVDAHSVHSSSSFTQCFPWAPTPLKKDASVGHNHSIQGVDPTNPTGAIVIGYHFQGKIDELRIYGNELLQTYDVVKSGGSIFDSELDVPQETLVGMAVMGFIVLVICAAMCISRLRREAAARRLRQQEEMLQGSAAKYDPVPPTHGGEEEKRPRPKQLDLTVSDNDDANDQGDGNGSTPDEVTEVQVFVADSPSSTPKKETDTNGDAAAAGAVATGVVVASEPSTTIVASESAASPTSRTAAEHVNDVLEHVESAMETIGDMLDEANKDVKKADRDEKMAAAATLGEGFTVAHQAIAGAQGKTGGTTGEVKGSVSIKTSNVNPLSVLKNVGTSLAGSQEYLLRATLVRDCWQVLQLFFVGFEWPAEFIEWWGMVTQAIAIDLDINYAVPFSATFYVIIGLAAFFLLVVIVIFFFEKMRTPEQLLEEQSLILEEKQKDENFKPKMTKKDILTFFAVFAVSGLYLPVTRNAVVVIFCHPSVQCVFDCYNESAHVLAFNFGVASLIFISLGAPLAFFLIIRKKRAEFAAFVGEDDSVDPEQAWTWFVRADTSPYRALYSGFELKWIYFQIVIMFVKSLMCLTTLGIEQNSVTQLAAIMGIQAVLTIAVFYSAPFLLDICDYIMQCSQAFVIIALIISCFYRAVPSTGYGEALTGSAACNLLVQLVLVIKHVKSD